MAKEYTLSVTTRSPRGRSKNRVITTGGGTVYVSSASSSPTEPTEPNTTGTPSTGGTNPKPPDTSGTTAPTTGTAWRLVANPSAVKVYNGSASPSVRCTVEMIRGGKVSQITTPDELDAEGVELWMAVDGGEWQKYIIGLPTSLATQSGRRIVTRSGRYLMTQGRDVDTSTVDNLIAFELRDRVTGRVLASLSVPVVRDGAMGAVGPMVYPAGIWKPGTTYKASDGACPVVMCGGAFFVLRPGETATGVNPVEDYALRGSASPWQPMESMQYVFADVLMANFAKLGAAVFYGDFMFSQDGTINGEPVSGLDANGVAYYTRFTDGKSAGTFIPNICVNFKSGYLGAAVGVFSGAIRTVFKPISESDAVRVTANQVAEPYITALKYELRSDVNISTDRGGSVHVVLPVGEDCLGMRVILADSQGLFSHAPARITVSTADGSMIGGIASADIEANVGNYCARWVEVYGGMIELICIWSNPTGTDNRPGWAVVSHRGRGIIGIYRQSGLNLLTTEYWKNN